MEFAERSGATIPLGRVDNARHVRNFVIKSFKNNEGLISLLNRISNGARGVFDFIKKFLTNKHYFNMVLFLLSKKYV